MKVSRIEDEKIIHKLHSDRAAGFRMLFDTYYMPLCLYSVQLTDDFDASEDIVQSFFVSFWENNIDRRIDGKLYSYLFTAIRNNTLVYLRKNGTTTELSLDDPIVSNNQLCELMDMEDNADEARRREDELYKALKALSPNELSALERVVLEEKSYKATSAEMGVSVNTLKTYLKRAMKKLRGTGVPVFLLFI